MRIYNYFTLLVAMTISACAAYYSIVGLTSIFSAAFVPIVIMGSALELGKLTGAVWLHMNWTTTRLWIKLYMVPAVAVLMLITSMGIFGFLSKAHIEQTAGIADLSTQLGKLDLDIKLNQEKIDSDKVLIKQLDDAVANLLATSATQGAQKQATNAKQASKIAADATKLRKSQEPERTRLQAEIDQYNSKISELDAQKLTIQQQSKKIEAEVGPIKYVAALFYGDNPDANTLEKSVRWMIILLVIVFDPLAVVLILAATAGLDYKPEEKIVEVVREVEVPVDRIVEVEVDRIVEVIKEVPVEIIKEVEKIVEVEVIKEVEITKEVPVEVVRQVYVEVPVEVIREVEKIVEVEPPSTDYALIDLLTQSINSRGDTVNDLIKAQSDFAESAPASGFGENPPPNPPKGFLFLKVDISPNKMYKWNGSSWIEVDRSRVDDTLVYNPEYIEYLIQKIKSGLVGLDDLSDMEQNQIALRLKNEQ